MALPFESVSDQLFELLWRLPRSLNTLASS